MILNRIKLCAELHTVPRVVPLVSNLLNLAELVVNELKMTIAKNSTNIQFHILFIIA